MVLFAFNVEAAETTYHCRHFQKDIDYWQEQYAIKVKENKSLYRELMEAKMEVLKQGIKIPNLNLKEICFNTKTRGIVCWTR